VAGAGVLLCGCYTKRQIVVPPTEHGRLCVNDANMAWQICMLQQRGKFFCDRRQDDELLRCEGAYEMTGSADGGAEEATYGLPGYKP
jgi:hypothetical protein